MSVPMGYDSFAAGAPVTASKGSFSSVVAACVGAALTVVSLGCLVLAGTSAPTAFLVVAPSPAHNNHIAVYPTVTRGALSGSAGVPSQLRPSLVSALNAQTGSAAAAEYVALPAAESQGVSTARLLLPALGAVAGVLLAVFSVAPAQAFDNAIPEAAQYSRETKNPGTMPTGLGMAKRVELDGDLGLKPCGRNLNCFSSTFSDPEEDKHFLAPWTPPASQSPAESIAQVKSVIERYPPGQAGIDGGGFQIVTSDPEYLYVQFESLKGGYIDDVEFGTEGPQVVVRSASRKGFIDQGVNSKRLNWIATELRGLNWDAPALTPKTHPLYFFQNFEFLNMQQQLAEVKETQRDNEEFAAARLKRFGLQDVVGSQ